MSRTTRALLTAALFAFALAARADALRLIAPAEGTTLRGGSFAELQWSAEDLPPSAEEWEAFLSLDGGKYYAFRLTPHLELDLQRFTFIVPNVDTCNARILIRVGDEVRETHFEARGTFSIKHDPRADVNVSRLVHFERGEAARDGDPGVVGWSDGARNGSAITWHSATPGSAPTIYGRTTVPETQPAEREAPGSRAVDRPSTARAQKAARNRHARRPDPLPIADDLLLVCRRRNI
jgi:hypothetical protein